MGSTSGAGQHRWLCRFNRRWNEDKLFYYLTRRAIDAKPLSYHRLIAEPIG